MPLTNLNVGAAPNDGTGDTLRSGGQKINTNYTFTVTTDTTQNITGTKTFTQTVTGGKFVPTANTETGNGMYLPAANTLAFSTANTERARIFSNAFVLVTNTASNFGSDLIYSTSAGTTTGSVDAVASGRNLGRILFRGANGTNIQTATLIQSIVDGTPSSTSMPGRLEFLTTPVGSNTLVERLRITNSGVIQLPSGSPGIKFGTRNANLNDYEQGTWTGTLTGGTTPPSTPVTATGIYTKIGNVVTIYIAFVNVNTTGASGEARITGLPFASAAGTEGVTAAVFHSLLVNETDVVAYHTLSGGQGIIFLSQGSGTPRNIRAASGIFVRLSMTYFAS